MQFERCARVGILAATLTLLVLGTGCAGVRLEPEIRAIWVTRSDLKSADDVKRIIDQCADAGFNTVLFQVRGNATVFYPSDLEPWAEQFGFEDPGFDPLATACAQARERRVALHAWVNVMPAWRGTNPPSHPKQLYHTHPDWFWYDQHGERQKLSSFYVSVNPCLPEVREYLVSVFQEIAERYPIDGLHMDYIRFPNEPPATPAGSDIDYPHDPATRALFRAATGKNPEDDADAWVAWRAECLTTLVTDIHTMLRRVRPRAALTAAVTSNPDRARERYFQDSRRWVQEGLLDAAFIMNYTDDPQVFRERMNAWLPEGPETQLPAEVVPGLWFGRHAGKTPAEAAKAVRAQVEIARELTGHFCVFAYASLFDSRDDTDLARQNEAQQSMRATRRAVLIPYFQSLVK